MFSDRSLISRLSFSSFVFFGAIPNESNSFSHHPYRSEHSFLVNILSYLILFTILYLMDREKVCIGNLLEQS